MEIPNDTYIVIIENKYGSSYRIPVALERMTCEYQSRLEIIEFANQLYSEETFRKTIVGRFTLDMNSSKRLSPNDLKLRKFLSLPNDIYIVMTEFDVSLKYSTLHRFPRIWGTILLENLCSIEAAITRIKLIGGLYGESRIGRIVFDDYDSLVKDLDSLRDFEINKGNRMFYNNYGSYDRNTENMQIMAG